MSMIQGDSLTYVAGDDVLMPFTVTDQDGAAVNITGATPRVAIARVRDRQVVLSTEESPATITATLTTPASGLFEASIDGAQTAGLRGTYRYEAEIEDVSGGNGTLIQGYVTFRPGVIE